MSRGPESVADRIAGAIAATGARYAFGHPGGEVVVLIDALQRAGVEFVLTHHETEAAFMASGAGEITGTPGVAISTLGPGATNMITGAASALLERAPVLLFTGALARAAPAGTTHQALDLNALYAPVTKRTYALTPESADADMADAVALAGRTPAGPVHLSLASDIATMPAEYEDSQGPDTAAGDPTRSSSASLRRARTLLGDAARPAIVIGLDALRADVAPAIRRFVRATGGVVATLPKAKGIVSESDDSFVGTLEMVGDDLVVALLRQADVVVAVGVDVVEFDKPWRLDTPVIQVDRIPTETVYLRSEIEMSGPLDALLDALAPDRPASGWPRDAIAGHRASLEAFVRTTGAPLQCWQVVRGVRAQAPPETIVASDVGAHKMVVGQAWPAYEPRTFFMANGLSSMGYSLPLAAAARLVKPDVPAVSFLGDGGLSMYLGELETLVRLRLDVVIVVFADGTLELIRRAQTRRQVPYVGTSFTNPDFEALGRAFGIETHRVGSRAELERTLPDVMGGRGVRLLVAEIDGNDYRF